MSGRAWTLAEEVRMLEMRRRLASHAVIAARLGRTVRAVRTRLHEKARGRDPAGRTPSEVGAILGVSQGVVRSWLGWGWLRGARDPGARRGYPRSGLNGQWRVRRSALVAFLEDERYWSLWDPARLTDAELRAWTTEMRAGVRFLTVREVERALNYSGRRVREFLHTGRLRGVKLRPARGGNPDGPSRWCVRADVLEAFRADRAVDEETVRMLLDTSSAEALRRDAHERGMGVPAYPPAFVTSRPCVLDGCTGRVPLGMHVTLQRYCSTRCRKRAHHERKRRQEIADRARVGVAPDLRGLTGKAA